MLHLEDFGHERGGGSGRGAGGWVNLLKKENLHQKSFSNNVEWSSKKLQKMTSTDITTDVKQEIKNNW